MDVHVVLPPQSMQVVVRRLAHKDEPAHGAHPLRLVSDDLLDGRRVALERHEMKISIPRKSLRDMSTFAGVKSTVIRTSVNIFEASKRDKPQYFVDKVKDKRRTKNNNLEFIIGWRGLPDPKDDTWEPLGQLSGSEHMIREFNEKWEKDYVRKTAETLEVQTFRRKRADEQNVQREDIDETMGEGAGDEEEDGESEDGYEDGNGTAGAAKRPGTQRRRTAPVSNLYAKTSGRTWRVGGSQI